MKRVVRWLGVAVAVAMVGCGGGSGAATGATCPSGGSSLTYANFGQGFMANYCVSCHGGSRASGGISLDTQAKVQAHLSAIDLTAAAGPSGTNTAMPESGTAPTAAERQQLGEWLACGAN